MTWIRILFLAALLGFPATAWSQSTVRSPHIGYLYPGGGRQGTSLWITAGGQYLRDPKKVFVTGEGVRATVIKYMRPFRNLNGDQRRLFRKRLKEVADNRLAQRKARSVAVVSKAPKKTGTRPTRTVRKKGKGKKAKGKKAVAPPKKPELPDHPLFYGFDSKSLRQLAHIVAVLQQVRGKRQINRQLAEDGLIRISIDANAPPGDRELRIGTGTGLTNPMTFQVGVVPEVRELEPNDRRANDTVRNPEGVAVLRKLPRARALALPVVLNGQIMPGDVDRFRFRALKGQPLVVETQARKLIPYLADAVPGWFQATLALYDAEGNEVAFVDGYRFHPDPVLFCRMPHDGEYEVEIRDAIYRGREDFVYRITVGEQPFITQMFPLGGKAGVETHATVKGWNLPETRLPLDTRAGATGIRRTGLEHGNGPSNRVAYAVDSLPELLESEPNDTPVNARTLRIPTIINGRIGRPGDVDVYCIRGHRRQKIVAEVFARRLDSPLDSLLRVTDASGRVVAWNDDHVLKDGHLHKDLGGLVTHHADAYLMLDLPRGGIYYIHLSDVQRHGSEAHAYRLRLTMPQPDFALRMTPSSVTVRGGEIVPIHVHVLRKDGFTGAIRVGLKKALGFNLIGGLIPAGCNHMRMTLKAPLQVDGSPVILDLEGRARINRRMIRHRVVPAEDMMQAFLYRHLVPSKELRVAVTPGQRKGPAVTVASRLPIRIPDGGTARVRVKGKWGRVLKEIQMDLKDPPEGLSLGKVNVGRRGLTFRVKAAKGKVPVGFTGSLIVRVYKISVPKGKDGKPTGTPRRTLVGILPAIPFKIMGRRVL